MLLKLPCANVSELGSYSNAHPDSGDLGWSQILQDWASVEKESKAASRLGWETHCDELVPSTVSKEKGTGLKYLPSLQYTKIIR